ncbi:MAG TPA: hypothetical protein VG496_18150, partial [Myxococcales bacterium]|nr:hypothetical protein [Myxococcales bacterium]
MSEPHPPETTPAYLPQPGARLPSPRKRRTVLRWFGIAALGIVGLVVVVIAAALVWLHTGAGEAKVASIVTNIARNSISGQLSMRSIQVRGFLTICADGIDVRDPDGNPAFAAERFCAHVNPLALRANRALLSDVQLVGARLDIASLEGPDGKPATTLSRALESRTAPSKETKGKAGPFEWIVDVTRLQVTRGSIAMRPGVGMDPTIALDGLDIDAPHLRYAADGADARINLRAELQSPGKDPIALDVDALLSGSAKTGSALVRELRVGLGRSGFVAQGQYDLGARTGELHVRELQVLPADVAVLSREGTSPLSGEVRGEADARLRGDSVSLTVRLDGGGGRIGIDASVTSGAAPAWQVAIALDKVNPERVASAAPAGLVTGRVEANGQGFPQLDEHGIRGDVALRAHLGPARLDRVGEVRVDTEGDVKGREALVRAFTATALGLRISAHGRASFDALALDLDVQAPDLRVVGAAMGAFRKQPSLPLSGSAQLAAHVTGAPRAPDAEVHLRAPVAQLKDVFDTRSLAVDGTLHGKLVSPDGALRVAADSLDVGQIALRGPRIEANLTWPWAHLRVDSAVATGRVLLAGDARIDDDRDGLSLANFTVSWPGNELRLAHDTRIHLREGLTIIEPLELLGEHGSIHLAAQLSSTRIDANAAVKDFDLSRLPNFAFPDAGVFGHVDANVTLKGARSRPDIDLETDVRGAGVRRTADLPVDAHARARLN